jgi:hypothetical protein
VFGFEHLALARPSVAAALCALDAHAGELPPDAAYRFPAADISGVLGVGTPTGIVGVETSISPAQWLAIAAGGGIMGGEPQWAAMLRPRLPVVKQGPAFAALTAGLGVSGGMFKWSQFCLLAPEGCAENSRSTPKTSSASVVARARP